MTWDNVWSEPLGQCFRPTVSAPKAARSMRRGAADKPSLTMHTDGMHAPCVPRATMRASRRRGDGFPAGPRLDAGAGEPRSGRLARQGGQTIQAPGCPGGEPGVRARTRQSRLSESGPGWWTDLTSARVRTNDGRAGRSCARTSPGRRSTGRSLERPAPPIPSRGPPPAGLFVLGEMVRNRRLQWRVSVLHPMPPRIVASTHEGRFGAMRFAYCTLRSSHGGRPGGSDTYLRNFAQCSKRRFTSAS
jgi:hypothetical protein